MGAFIVVMLAASFGIVNTLLDSEHTSIEKGDSIDMETKGGLHMFEVFKKNLVDIIYNFQLHLGKLHLSATIICVIIVTAVVTCGVGKYYMMALLNIIQKSPRGMVRKIAVQEKSDCGSNSNGCVEGK